MNTLLWILLAVISAADCLRAGARMLAGQRDAGTIWLFVFAALAALILAVCAVVGAKAGIASYVLILLWAVIGALGVTAMVTRKVRP